MAATRLAMAGVLGVGMIAALPAEARADVRVAVGIVIGGHDERGPRHSPRRAWHDTGPAWRYGYDRGWRDGSEDGHEDARKRRGADPGRHGDFRDADNGYKRWMGSRREFSDGYREGFAAGYRRAYVAARPSWRDRASPRWEGERRPHPDFERR
jgi:hypothetical protein